LTYGSVAIYLHPETFPRFSDSLKMTNFHTTPVFNVPTEGDFVVISEQFGCVSSENTRLIALPDGKIF